MNKSSHLVFEVTRWEFLRFFKVKDVIMTLAILLFLSALLGGGMWYAQRGTADKPKVAVVNANILHLDSVSQPYFDFRFAQPQEEAALRASVERRELAGLLIIRSVDNAELVTYRDQFWVSQLEGLLTSLRSQIRLAQLNLGPKEFESVMVPFQLTKNYQEAVSRPSGTVEKIYAGAVVMLMILAVFTCYQYQFTSITGEKHLRVTEQIVSAISPQVWMDGKILGISAIGIALIIIYGVFTLLISGIVWWFLGYDVTQLFQLADPRLTLLLLTLALLGILFWNCFFAAVAATIDDPNTSSRGVIMFLPFLPVAITLAGLRNPDSTMMKVLAMFPVTSPAALSARLVITKVEAWEVLVALALLLATIWLLRKAAAKIFRIAMLMYGKEPSLAEIGRWLYES